MLWSRDMMRKILSVLLALFITFIYSGAALAIQAPPQTAKLQYAPNAKSIELGFVFDGPSDKNAQVLKAFQQAITRSLAPDFKAAFPNDLIFTGDWTEQGAANVSEKALKSRAKTVISLGYLSSVYLSKRKNANKYVITIDEYGLRDFGSSAFFNPLKQHVTDMVTFKTLVPSMTKVAILINENFYNTKSDWNSFISTKFKEKNVNLDFVAIPVSNKNLEASLNRIPNDVNAVYVTPMFNLTQDQRKELYIYINNKKIPSFSSLGKEDVELGAMLGTSTPDVDRKIAEATSFDIHGYLHGKAVKSEKIPFYDDKVIFYNKDTGKLVGYVPPLRLLNNCEIISTTPITKYDLSYVFNRLEESNLDITRKKYLVDAARRATVSAYLRYLPTLRMDLGYQTFNSDYAESYSAVPTRAGQFVIGMDQVLYSPDLVTNIIVKHKKLKFDKAEKVLTEQNIGLQAGFLYLDTLMLENMIKVQEEYLKETRENLAIARVREKTGKCGYEEVLRWAGQVSEAEKKLLNMQADYRNVKVSINKLLYKDQTEEFTFAPLTASDAAFYTKDLHVIDHVRNPEKLAKFTDLLVEEAIYLAPETTKLKAAIAMKKAEIGNYVQKFFMPNAKLTMEYGTQFGRHIPYEEEGHLQMKSAKGAAAMGMYGSFAAFGPAYMSSPYLGLNKTYGRFMIAAQWKPIEGGTKFAEIARCKAELNELNAYLEEVNTAIEMNVRQVINRAIAKYFMIEKSYKAMFAEGENYQMVKSKYLRGETTVTQLADAQHLYTSSKLDALNSQYEFFKELMWVQRALVSVNWTKPSKEAREWVDNIPKVLPAEDDFTL